MVFLQELKKGYFYIVKKVKGKKEIVRTATKDEIELYKKYHQKDSIDIAPVTCANPECDKQVNITRNQKKKFFVTYILSYGTLRMPCCSEKCRIEYERALKQFENYNK